MPGAKVAVLGPADSGSSVHVFKPFTIIPHKVLSVSKADDGL